MTYDDLLTFKFHHNVLYVLNTGAGPERMAQSAPERQSLDPE
jgi:hypothetical protein